MKVIKRWATIIVGGLVLAVGVMLIPVPGPGGLPVTLAGLAILSSELPWAHRLLDRLKRRIQTAGSDEVDAGSWRRRAALATGLLALWVVGGIVAWRIWAF